MYLPDKKVLLRKKMIESIDLVLDQYVSSKYVDEMLESDWKNDGVEVVKHIPEFVLKSAFTPAQICFMENDPLWKVVFPENQKLKTDPYKQKNSCVLDEKTHRSPHYRELWNVNNYSTEPADRASGTLGAGLLLGLTEINK